MYRHICVYTYTYIHYSHSNHSTHVCLVGFAASQAKMGETTSIMQHNTVPCQVLSPAEQQIVPV